MASENGYVVVQVNDHGGVTVFGPATGGLYADMDAAQTDADRITNPDEDRLEIQGVVSVSEAQG